MAYIAFHGAPPTGDIGDFDMMSVKMPVQLKNVSLTSNYQIQLEINCMVMIKSLLTKQSSSIYTIRFANIRQSISKSRLERIISGVWDKDKGINCTRCFFRPLAKSVAQTRVPMTHIWAQQITEESQLKVVERDTATCLSSVKCHCYCAKAIRGPLADRRLIVLKQASNKSLMPFNVVFTLVF